LHAFFKSALFCSIFLFFEGKAINLNEIMQQNALF